MISQERLRSILHYDPETGIFIWLEDRGPCKVKGKVAGSVGNLGYVSIKIDNIQRMAHRLAWVWVNGELSDKFCIDHIDHNPSNNKISNLRVVSDSQNGFNRKIGSNNTSGTKGVYPYLKRPGAKLRWGATIKVNKNQINLGIFDNKEDAIRARKQAELEYHGQYRNGGTS